MYAFIATRRDSSPSSILITDAFQRRHIGIGDSILIRGTDDAQSMVVKRNTLLIRSHPPSQEDDTTVTDDTTNDISSSSQEVPPSPSIGKQLVKALELLSTVFFQTASALVSIGLVMNLLGYGYTVGEDGFGTVKIEKLSKMREDRQFEAQYRSHESRPEDGR